MKTNKQIDAELGYEMYCAWKADKLYTAILQMRYSIVRLREYTYNNELVASMKKMIINYKPLLATPDYAKYIGYIIAERKQRKGSNENNEN